MFLGKVIMNKFNVNLVQLLDIPEVDTNIVILNGAPCILFFDLSSNSSMTLTQYASAVNSFCEIGTDFLVKFHHCIVCEKNLISIHFLLITYISSLLF